MVRIEAPSTHEFQEYVPSVRQVEEYGVANNVQLESELLVSGTVQVQSKSSKFLGLSKSTTSIIYIFIYG